MYYAFTLTALYFLCLFESNQVKYISAILFGIYFISSSLNGIDWLNYFYLYNMPGCCEFVRGWYEPGFLFLVYVSQEIGLNYIQFSVVVSSTICFFILLYSMAVKNTHVVLFMVFATLGYYAFQDQYRQGLALAIVAYALTVRSDFRSALLCTLSALFHASGLVGLVVLFIDRRDNSNKIYNSIAIALIMLISVVVYSSLSKDFLIYLNSDFSWIDLLSPGRIPYIVLIILFLLSISCLTITVLLESFAIYVLSFFGQIYRFGYFLWIDLIRRVCDKLPVNFRYKHYLLFAFYIIGYIPFGNESHRHVLFNPYYIFEEFDVKDVAADRCQNFLRFSDTEWILDACSKY